MGCGKGKPAFECDVSAAKKNPPIPCGVSFIGCCLRLGNAERGGRSLASRAGVKWVNDILIDGAKVAGFVTHTQSQEHEVKSVVLGIGLNVATIPLVPPDAFVPRVASLSQYLPGNEACSLDRILFTLLNKLDKNYHLILEGKIAGLLDFYRESSLVLGRRVRVISDPISGKSQELASGRVSHIGENLELHLEDRPAPVTQGRLILEE